MLEFLESTVKRSQQFPPGGMPINGSCDQTSAAPDSLEEEKALQEKALEKELLIQQYDQELRAEIAIRREQYESETRSPIASDIIQNQYDLEQQQTNSMKNDVSTSTSMQNHPVSEVKTDLVNEPPAVQSEIHATASSREHSAKLCTESPDSSHMPECTKSDGIEDMPVIQNNTDTSCTSQTSTETTCTSQSQNTDNECVSHSDSTHDTSLPSHDQYDIQEAATATASAVECEQLRSLEIKSLDPEQNELIKQQRNNLFSIYEDQKNKLPVRDTGQFQEFEDDEFTIQCDYDDEEFGEVDGYYDPDGTVENTSSNAYFSDQQAHILDDSDQSNSALQSSEGPSGNGQSNNSALQNSMGNNNNYQSNLALQNSLGKPQVQENQSSELDTLENGVQNLQVHSEAFRNSKSNVSKLSDNHSHQVVKQHRDKKLSIDMFLKSKISDPSEHHLV